MIKALKSILRPFVKTLVYFSSPDLMVEVTYKKIRNSIKYASHREMLFRERFGVEHYLLSNIAVKMGYYKSQPAMLKYTGVDTSLLRELSHVHSIDTPPSINSTETQLEDRQTGRVSFDFVFHDSNERDQRQARNIRAPVPVAWILTRCLAEERWREAVCVR